MQANNEQYSNFPDLLALPGFFSYSIISKSSRANLRTENGVKKTFDVRCFIFQDWTEAPNLRDDSLYLIHEEKLKNIRKNFHHDHSEQLWVLIIGFCPAPILFNLIRLVLPDVDGYEAG